MAGRPCSICKSTEKARIATEMIAAGASDQAVADRLGVARTSVLRHRHAHIVAPAKALVDAANKGRDAAEQRAQVMAAAEAGDPSAFVALTAIVADLRKVHARLERQADAAEQDNQRLAVASLSSAQLRAAEVRAKIGGVGGYAPTKGAGASEGAPFVVNFCFSGGRTQTLGMTAADGPVIEGEAPSDLPERVECRLAPATPGPKWLPSLSKSPRAATRPASAQRRTMRSIMRGWQRPSQGRGSKAWAGGWGPGCTLPRHALEEADAIGNQVRHIHNNA